MVFEFLNMTGSLTKSEKLFRTWDIQETELQPEYCSISCELPCLTKMIHDGFSGANPSMFGLASNDSGFMFERGRFYEEYSARRNERLKRKKGREAGEPRKTAYDLGVTMESSKKRDPKKLEILRKSVAVAYSAERDNKTLRRYMLRSSTKENKKPPLSAASSFQKSVIDAERRVGMRKIRKI